MKCVYKCEYCDEIKEILEELQDENSYWLDCGFKTTSLSYDEAHLLLDYITKLQQIEQDHQKLNGELREENNKLQEEIERWAYKYQHDLTDKQWEIEDYKSRNEKAIEYIKEWQSFPHTNGSTHRELQNLSNILNGGDKDGK